MDNHNGDGCGDFCFEESAVGFHGLSGNDDGKLFFLLLLQFYYGDINMARDKFLQEQIKLDDGCIFSVLISIRNMYNYILCTVDMLFCLLV